METEENAKAPDLGAPRKLFLFGCWLGCFVGGLVVWLLVWLCVCWLGCVCVCVFVWLSFKVIVRGALGVPPLGGAPGVPHWQCGLCYGKNDSVAFVVKRKIAWPF